MSPRDVSATELLDELGKMQRRALAAEAELERLRSAPTPADDEAVTAVALALADEVRTWPADSGLPYNSAVGVGKTFQVLARVALGAAAEHAPARPMPTREQIEQVVGEVAAATGLAAYFKGGTLTDPSDLDEFTAAIHALVNGEQS